MIFHVRSGVLKEKDGGEQVIICSGVLWTQSWATGEGRASVAHNDRGKKTNAGGGGGGIGSSNH